MARHLFRPLAALALALSACAAAAAQNNERDRDSWSTSSSSAEVSGQVRASGDPAPARGVRVQLERIGGGVIDQMMTDGRGRFRFASLPRGQYVVSVSAPCRLPERRQVELVVIFRAYLDVELAADTSSPNCAAPRPAAGVVDARVPAPARAEYERAQAALRDRKRDEALGHLREAVRLYPDFYEAHLLLGTAYTDARRLEEAASSLRRASELNPKSVAALVSLGEVRRRQKLYPDALEALEAALRLDAESWQGHFTLGLVYWESGEVKRAAPHAGRALQLKPDFAEAHLLAGNVLLGVGERERALAEYEEYLRLAPEGDYAAATREMARKLRREQGGKKAP